MFRRPVLRRLLRAALSLPGLDVLSTAALIGPLACAHSRAGVLPVPGGP
jgi:hypothetical protein